MSTVLAGMASDLKMTALSECGKPTTIVLAECGLHKPLFKKRGQVGSCFPYVSILLHHGLPLHYSAPPSRQHGTLYSSRAGSWETNCSRQRQSAPGTSLGMQRHRSRFSSFICLHMWSRSTALSPLIFFWNADTAGPAGMHYHCMTLWFQVV